jgi:hypothetical protein
MPFQSSISGLACTECLLSGTPLTSLEAMLRFGYADIARKVTWMRQSGLAVKSRSVKLSAVLARIEKDLGGPVPIGVWPQVQISQSLQGSVVTEYYLVRKSRDEALAKVVKGLLSDIDAVLKKEGLTGSVPEPLAQLLAQAEGALADLEERLEAAEAEVA